MSKKVEKRKCLACGAEWEVEVKVLGAVKNPRCLCNKCINTLSSSEKQHYYRFNEGKAILEDRVCLNCGKTWKVATSKIAKTDKDKKRYFCTECCKILSMKDKKRLMKQLREGFREKVYYEKRNSNIRNLKHCIWKRAKQRAEKHNMDFNITEEDIIIPEVCPILEVPLIYGIKGNYEYSPSLDRIDNNKGYIKGNIQVVSKKANSMKNSASLEELHKFCKNILRYSLNNTEKECIEL